MTAHELAQKLLDGPDVPVIIQVEGYELVEVTEIQPWAAPTDHGPWKWLPEGGFPSDDPAIELL